MFPYSTLDELVGIGNCQGMSDKQNDWDAKAGDNYLFCVSLQSLQLRSDAE